jgi:hypothetical protein
VNNIHVGKVSGSEVPVLDQLIAGATDYQGFAAPGSHPPFPLGQRSPVLQFQVSELSHVMNFDVLQRATQLTCLS